MRNSYNVHCISVAEIMKCLFVLTCLLLLSAVRPARSQPCPEYSNYCNHVDNVEIQSRQEMWTWAENQFITEKVSGDKQCANLKHKTEEWIKHKHFSLHGGTNVLGETYFDEEGYPVAMSFKIMPDGMEPVSGDTMIHEAAHALGYGETYAEKLVEKCTTEEGIE